MNIAAGARLRSVELRSSTTDPRSFRFCVGSLGAALSTGLVLLLLVEGVPPVAPLLVLAALVIIAENRDRLFGDETSVSGSIAVGTAAVFVFSSSTPLVGPLVIASCAAIYWPHIRDRQGAKMIVNAASIGFSALAGASVFVLAPPLEKLSGFEAFLWTLPVVVAYWLVNGCVLSLASTCLRGGTFRSAAVTLLGSEKNLLIFAVGGGLSGVLYARESAAVGASALAVLLILFDRFVVAEQHLRFASPDAVRRTAIALLPKAGAALGCWLLIPRFGLLVAVAIAAGGGVLVATLIALMRFRAALGTWEVPLAFGTVLADLPLLVVAVVGGVMVEAFGVAAALLFGLVALVIGRVLGDWLRRRRDRVSPDDQELLEAIELALMDRRFGTPHAR